MFVITDEMLTHHAARLYLAGEPTDSIGERVAAAKIVDFSAARARLRPPAPGSLNAVMNNIADAFSGPSDG